MFVVVSVAHLDGRDRTFLHGVFQDWKLAEEVRGDIESGDWKYIEREGYSLDGCAAIVSVYIADLPLECRVDEFVPTIL